MAVSQAQLDPSYYNNCYHYFHSLAVFPDEPGSAGFPFGPPAPPVLEKNLWGLVEWSSNTSDVLCATQPSASVL